MNKPKIQVVDENDQPTRAASVEEVWQTGERHRIVWVIIEDGKGNILLQKRTKTKPLWPDRWDVSSGGHVDAGENYEQAAAREAMEEINLTGLKLEFLDKLYREEEFEGKKLNRFYKLYRAVVPRQKIIFDSVEVAEVKWLPVDHVRLLVKQNPDKVTGGLKYAVENFYNR
ncbi:NUDIX domain-containing protein [Candidatus Parcubacteria bacterium]|nr:NUDIX domain-containing protein [Candidatus Parcubacteria bacterium]